MLCIYVENPLELLAGDIVSRQGLNFSAAVNLGSQIRLGRPLDLKEFCGALWITFHNPMLG